MTDSAPQGETKEGAPESPAPAPDTKCADVEMESPAEDVSKPDASGAADAAGDEDGNTEAEAAEPELVRIPHSSCVHVKSLNKPCKTSKWLIAG